MIRFRLPRFSVRLGTAGFGLIAAAIFGLALILAITDIGISRIWDEVLGVGIGLAGIILVHIGQLALCALAWHTLLSNGAGGVRVRFTRLFGLRWMRESIDSLLPVAQVGGALAAARLLARSGLSLPVAGASIIADVTIEVLTLAVFTLFGLVLLFALAEPGDVAHWAALGFAVAVIFAAVAVFAQRWGGVRLFERLLLTIAERMGWSRLEGVAGLDAALSAVYRLRGRLATAGLYHLAAWSLGAAEVWIAAKALGHPLDAGQAYVIESLAQAVRSVAFFVPGALGVQEGGFVLIAGLFGVPVDAAVSISLTKRVRELALGLPGLAAWQIAELRLRRSRRATPVAPT